MRKNFLIFLLLVLGFFFFSSCSPPNIPGAVYRYVDIRYVRTLPIINPLEPDPQGFNILSDEFGPLGDRGGMDWTNHFDNVWETSDILLIESKLAYHLYTIDLKVTKEYESVATKFFVRIQGQDWVELQSSPNEIRKGEWATFYIWNNKIHLFKP